MDENNVNVVTLDQLLGGMFGPQEAPEPEPVTARPTIFGTKGRAWQADLSVLRAAAMSRSADLSQDHIVAMWLVEAPGALPSCHTFAITLVSLDGEDCNHWLEGSTHEFSVFPVAPVGTRDGMLSGVEQIPLDGNRGPIFAAQLQAESHKAATERLAATVQEICNGDLVPDYDQEAGWVERFGDTNVDPEWVNAERLSKAVGRYHEALKGLEVAVAYAAMKEPRNVEPAYLRHGVDSVNVSITGLAKLLIDKGVISNAEYVEAVAEAAVSEYHNYSSRLGLPALAADADDAAGK